MTSLAHHLAPALLVIFRLGGLTIYGPVFGSQIVPVKVKVLLTFLLGGAAYPLLWTDVLSGQELPALTLWTLAPLVATELLIGLCIGFMASLPLLAVQTSGLVMGQQMGLGFARLFNPAIDDEADIVGQLLFFMVLAGFLVVGGHEAMLVAVLNSFEHVPLGGFVVDLDLLALLAGMLNAVLELALRVAAPLLALIFLESLAMGFVAKTVPQLNILSLGFPLRILAGLLIVFLGLTVIDQVIMEEIDKVITIIMTWSSGDL